MAVDVRGKHPRDVLSYQGSGPPHEARQCDHQYRIGQFRHAKSDSLGLRDDKGRYPELHRRAGANAGPEGHSRQRLAPGPVWTPLIPSTMPEDAVKNFGKQVPMKRPGQPVELATTYVMLADPMSSYVSGATVPVTGGKPFI